MSKEMGSHLIFGSSRHGDDSQMNTQFSVKTARDVARYENEIANKSWLFDACDRIEELEKQLDAFEDLKLSHPRISAKRRAELESFRKLLSK